MKRGDQNQKTGSDLASSPTVAESEPETTTSYEMDERKKVASYPRQARGFPISSAKYRSRGQIAKRRMRRVSGVMTPGRAGAGLAKSVSIPIVIVRRRNSSRTGEGSLTESRETTGRSVSGIGGTSVRDPRQTAVFPATPSLGLGPGKPELVLACISKVI